VSIEVQEENRMTIDITTAKERVDQREKEKKKQIGVETNQIGKQTLSQTKYRRNSVRIWNQIQCHAVENTDPAWICPSCQRKVY
jgi:hypothetical protein